MRCAVISLLLLQLLGLVEAKKRLKVLVYSTTISYSHIVYNGRLAEILKDAGHEVHLLLPVTDPNMPYDGSGKANRVFNVPLPHGQDILAELGQLSAISNPFSGTINMIMDGFLNTFRRIDNIVCRDVLQNDELMWLLKAENYDIGIAEALSDWPFGLFHELGIRTTFGTTPVPLPYAVVTLFGIPNPNSFTPTPTTTVSVNGDHMDLWERAQNTFFNFCQDVFNYLLYINQQQIFNELYGSDFPDLRALKRNMSFIFANSNPLLDIAKAASPKVIYIGDVVESTRKNLSQELRTVFDRSRKGVVFFSLGTLANTQHMPAGMKKALLASFARFPEYEFIWKHTEDTNHSGEVTKLPSNVHVFNWVDQVAILEHPKLAAFITHCGLNSLNEAALNGVPLVTIPLFADQLYNSAIAKSRGISVYLDVRHVTEDAVFNALNDVLSNPRYRENAQLLKRKLANYPLKPAELFRSHVEYAAEFPPLSELNLAGAEMSEFAYHNLDVWLIFSSALLLMLFTLFKISVIVVSAVVRPKSKLD